MKILALRIRNLTSLAGEVTVDFSAPPLAQAGLFAITGPTGAGKSTLLDGLCLALYNQMPRLPSAGDVRSALRHGTAHGAAEVDFIGADGGHYRARWEVRRARNKPGATLQAQTLSLTDLDSGAALGGGKRETLAAIQDKVGLDYQQFRRSVLLAQNDFDAFLRAKPDERASLLELMTGTAIYGDVSRAAYGRSKAETEALQALEGELKRVDVMDDSARAQADADAQSTQALAATLSAEMTGLGNDLGWYRTNEHLAEKSTQAQAAYETAKSDWVGAKPEREKIARLRLAQSLLPLADEVTRLGGEADRLSAEHQATGLRLTACDDECARLDRLCQDARQADDQAEAAFRQAGPVLDQAADLDARISDVGRRLDQCRIKAQASGAVLAEAQGALTRCEEQRDDLARTVTRLAGWLDQHQSHAPLAEQSERWGESIADHARAAADHRAAQAVLAGAGPEQKRLHAHLEKLDGEVRDLTRQRDDLGQEMDRLAQSVDGEQLRVLDARRDGLARLLASLTDLDTLSGTARALAQRRHALDGRRHGAQQRQAQARADLTAIAADLDRNRTACAEAQSALALAEAAESEQALVLRQHLISGEPCPVCGSRQHAVGAVHDGLGIVLAALRRRVGELQGDHDRLLDRQGMANADDKSATETLDHVATDTLALAEDERIIRRDWQQNSQAAAQLAEEWQVDLALPSDPGGDMAKLCAALAACRADQDETGRRVQAMRDADSDYRRLGGLRDQLQTRLNVLATQQGADQAALVEWREKCQAATDQADRTSQSMTHLADRLSVPLAPIGQWRDWLRDDPARLTRTVMEMARDWLDISGQSKTAQTDLTAKQNACASATAALAHASTDAARDKELLAQEQAEQTRLSIDRAALLDGQPTADVRRRLDDACKARRQAHELAKAAQSKAIQEHSAQKSRLDMLAQSLEKTRANLAQATERRDRRLDETGLDLDQLAEAAQLGEEWLIQAEARQTALQDAGTQAKAVLAERQGQWDEHQRSRPPQHDPQELERRLADCTTRRDEALALAAQWRQRLDDDDRHRGTVRHILDRIEAQRNVTDLWAGMADLIGSADGKKFRMFAQGLTLDRLLILANGHMADLTPRYALQRAPGSNLDLQVIDRDMADEVRAVANLSGGERFLVSLALALGLASMTGARTLAENLFIDEGFGALDSDSLDMAIAALETLHAAGRTIGIISHVQPMIDRIGVQIRVTRRGGGRSQVETRLI